MRVTGAAGSSLDEVQQNLSPLHSLGDAKRLDPKSVLVHRLVQHNSEKHRAEEKFL